MVYRPLSEQSLSGDPGPAGRHGKDLADNDGATPLFVAAENGHGAIVRALLDASADKTARCRGKMALDVAKTAEIKSLLYLEERTSNEN